VLPQKLSNIGDISYFVDSIDINKFKTLLMGNMKEGSFIIIIILSFLLTWPLYALHERNKSHLSD
jgi:hypothetical protein